MAKSKEPRIETPLLKAYLRTIDPNPAYMIQWPVCFQTCLRMAEPTARHDDQFRREWRAISEDKTLVGAVVQGIEDQRRRMESDFEPDVERLTALRELESELPSMPELHTNLYLDKS